MRLGPLKYPLHHQRRRWPLLQRGVGDGWNGKVEGAKIVEKTEHKGVKQGRRRRQGKRGGRFEVVDVRYVRANEANPVVLRESGAGTRREGEWNGCGNKKVKQVDLPSPVRNQTKKPLILFIYLSRLPYVLYHQTKKNHSKTFKISNLCLTELYSF